MNRFNNQIAWGREVILRSSWPGQLISMQTIIFYSSSTWLDSQFCLSDHIEILENCDGVQTTVYSKPRLTRLFISSDLHSSLPFHHLITCSLLCIVLQLLHATNFSIDQPSAFSCQKLIFWLQVTWLTRAVASPAFVFYSFDFISLCILFIWTVLSRQPRHSARTVHRSLWHFNNENISWDSKIPETKLTGAT